MSERIEYQKVVPYTAAHMYALVNTIENYADFVPYCQKSVVHARTDLVIEATLDLSLSIPMPFVGDKEIHHAFRTRNYLTPNERMDMVLIDGPMKKLEGTWMFEDLEEGQSMVRLSLEIVFRNPMYAVAFRAVSHQVAERLVKAFVDRAETIYGVL